ncbi:BRO family protein [Glaesserella parasuis]|uniref:BRO-N domain-containing protein n=1 Tax=Glaesserella parasuis TaxID=738 RepID=UPI001352EED7|nr:BRO family protein [Glaesserella parasuis]MDG6354830.1 BRO family protein [Glaesserella parasuis]MDO9673885.1 BRO family protein [Glaesserella parasuis]MDO9985313.1 BRO family protein [Glaesserella parasuis]MDO9992656.1 BRO family protein [Glaesserella parasuis]MDP0061182.1 BRO family protein [Glaesserella parasuis]
MSNQISTFNFKSQPVRIQSLNDEPYFCLTDVCLVLGVNRRSSEAFRLNEKGCNKIAVLTEGGMQEVVFINEPNLYRIIFRSNKSQAIDFQNWVFEEVLPQIRKTGQYSQNSAQIAPLAEIEADEEALHIIVNLFHSLNGAYEMGEKIRREHQYLAKEIDKTIGGHYLYNLNGPTENALTKARKYVHAKSERIMFVKGMLSLLEEPKQTARF